MQEIRSVARMAVLILLAFSALWLAGCGLASTSLPVPDATFGPVDARMLFEHTGKAAPRYVSTCTLSCSNCHTHAGRLDHALSLGGVHHRYVPHFSVREGRVISLQDRIRGCFARSLNGIGPADDSPEMRALVAYIGTLPGGTPQSIVPNGERVPMKDLSVDRGRQLYMEKCSACHQPDGSGTGPFPPLWGPHSYNDGAGLARVYTLAAFIHDAMPLAQGGTLSMRDAQDIARFIDAQPRPVYAGKGKDYPDGRPPVDAVYYAVTLREGHASRTKGR